jgi:hypothetical protein
MRCMFAVLLILKHKTMTTRSNEEIEARKAENTRNLISHYTEELKRENLRPISRRYYEDMLIAFTSEGEGAEHKKKEINAFWNEVEAKRDAENNKIEFLQEAIEYLRELVVEVADPDNSLMKRNSIVREVKNKNFISDIRERVRMRIIKEERRMADSIAKKDADYKDKIKEALKRIG